MTINLNTMAKTVFEKNKSVGWWDDMDRCVYQTLQLVSTEIAEATEGERKNLMDDKLPHRKMGEVELADAAIRLLDMAGRYDWPYIPEAPWDIAFYEMFSSIKSIAGQHLMVNIAIGELAKSIYKDDGWQSSNYSVIMDCLYSIAKKQGYDLEGALFEKFAFNKDREDHKRANRALDGGKKF